MATEKKAGVRVYSRVASSLHKKAKRKAKKNNTNISQIIRDFLQGYTKN